MLTIKALLKDATYINIIDGYLYENWDENFTLLKELLPDNASIVIYCKYQNKLFSSDKNKLKEIKVYKPKIKNFSERDKNISKIDISKIHDRYIITDRIVILLSSGLSSIIDKEKDFTYIVKEKLNNANSIF